MGRAAKAALPRSLAQLSDPTPGALATILEVLEAQRLFGDPDYLLRVVTADKAVYQQLYDD